MKTKAELIKAAPNALTSVGCKLGKWIGEENNACTNYNFEIVKAVVLFMILCICGL